MNHFDEQKVKEKFLNGNTKKFHDFITNYDDQMVSVMKEQGYTYVHSTERTVVFTFGEMTFKRRRWKKGNEWKVPVDEKLGLEKNVRFSYEFMYQIARLSTMMPYDKVTQVINLTYQVYITKPTVVKAVKLCGKLLKEKEDYQYFKEEVEVQKIKADVIYIEGDGVMVKARDKTEDNRNYELAHFVVHTGSKEVSKARFKLQEKKEFVSLSNSLARKTLTDYLYNHYEVNENTLLISNSDGGKGYTPYVFKEVAQTLGIKRHEHFWDEYHLNKLIKDYFKQYSHELVEKVFQAIETHDKAQLRLVFDTTESMITSEEEMEEFRVFKKRLLNNFQYTKPAKLRNLSHAGIGVMESQHRKITYRMKKRGMYWTKLGVETMSKMIVLVYEDELRDLFFGSWREEYEKIQETNKLSAAQACKQDGAGRRHEIASGNLLIEWRWGKKR